jgi:hypothetical protein
MRHRWMPHKGQSLVEFALIAPLLFALMFILVELGIVFSIYIGLTNSAREAARAGSVYQYPNPSALYTTPSCDATCHRATVDAGREAAMDTAIMMTLNPIIRITSIDQLGSAASRYTYEATQNTDIFRYGDKLTVTLTYPHSLFFNLLGPASINIRAQSEMKLEPGGR